MHAFVGCTTVHGVHTLTSGGPCLLQHHPAVSATLHHPALQPTYPVTAGGIRMVEPLRVQASYIKLFQELVTNCSHELSCSALRENDSNSMDAGATWKHFSALPGMHGFAQFDNGCGIDTKASGGANSVVPLDAFFSLGLSSKVKHLGNIGHKGQGSKLTLGGNGPFVLVTRVKTDPKGQWNVVRLREPLKDLDSASKPLNSEGNQPIAVTSVPSGDVARVVNEWLCKHLTSAPGSMHLR